MAVVVIVAIFGLVLLFKGSAQGQATRVYQYKVAQTSAPPQGMPQGIYQPTFVPSAGKAAVMPVPEKQGAIENLSEQERALYEQRLEAMKRSYR